MNGFLRRSEIYDRDQTEMFPGTENRDIEARKKLFRNRAPHLEMLCTATHQMLPIRLAAANRDR